MAREKVDRGDIFERAQNSRKGAASHNQTQDDNQDFMTKRIANFEIDVPDSHVLLSILNRKGKFDEELKSNLRRWENGFDLLYRIDIDNYLVWT